MTRPKPLWKVEDQKARLSELTAPSDDSAKDHALRRDVRSLGALLGRVLVGQELFDTVEELWQLIELMSRKQRGRDLDGNDLAELEYPLGATINGIAAGLHKRVGSESGFGLRANHRAQGPSVVCCSTASRMPDSSLRSPEPAPCNMRTL